MNEGLWDGRTSIPVLWAECSEAQVVQVRVYGRSLRVIFGSRTLAYRALHGSTLFLL
jgi:hypothetical protein